MAMAAKVAQQQLADKKKKDEEERLRGFGGDWESWSPDNSVADIASLQRGLRDFAGYCRGCHALKYLRYSRMAMICRSSRTSCRSSCCRRVEGQRLRSTPMPAADALTWFGKVPPDLSLIARSRGTDYLFGS